MLLRLSFSICAALPVYFQDKLWSEIYGFDFSQIGKVIAGLQFPSRLTGSRTRSKSHRFCDNRFMEESVAVPAVCDQEFNLEMAKDSLM
jgi:hypothetical protein